MTDAAPNPSVPPAGATEFDLDHFDQEYVDDPTPTWAAMRHMSGVWSPRHGGFHVLSRYADVAAAATDWETFTSTQGVNIPPMPFPPFVPLEVDPPDHREYRRILNPAMSPEVANQWEPRVRELAVELLEKIQHEREVDLGTAFATPFPKTVALRLIGYPDEDLDRLDNWVEHIVGEHKERDGAADLAMEFFVYITEFIARRRADPRQDDLISVLLDADFHGRPFTDDELLPQLLLLTFGGLHTTSSAIAGMLLWLADHPEGRAQLRDDPSLIATAVDEFLRYTTPVNQMGRTAVKDSTVGGCPISAGDKVLLLWGSACHDEAEFDDADQVVLDRSPNRHVAFGIGPHRCVGSHLAKVMVRVALEESLARLGDFHVEDRSGLLFTGGEARGLRHLPVVLDGR